MKAFEKIIGYANEKKELMRIADVLKNSEYYKKLGAKPPKGLLLDGSPGLGKTLMANALIEASGRQAFICRKDKPDGDFVNHIKETFDKALESAPSIVFLDDMDKFANEDERRPNAEEYVTVQSCIDNVKDKDVFVLATTNNKRSLPDSLLRAGRFDRIMNIYSPEHKDAIEIIKYYLRGKDIIDIDPEYIAKLLHRSSCATIETIINEAAVLAGFERCEKISLSHFMEACTKTVFRHDAFEVCDQEFDLNDMHSALAEITYHEAGHAIVSEILSPESVTLVGLGNYGGHTTCFDPQKDLDKRCKNKDVIISLSGIAAIEQKFGQKGRGAQSDLQNARRSINYQIKNNVLCGLSFSETYEPVDSNERIKNQEYAADILLDQYYTKAKMIIAQNREFLERVASELAEKKLLTSYDIQRIKSECTIKEVDVL